MIIAESVSFSYGAGLVLRDVSVSIASGDYILLRGESGCGKSTFLRLLSKLEIPDTGRLLFRGDPYASIPSPDLRRQIAYLQQLPVMIAGNVRENLTLPFRFIARDVEPPSDPVLDEMLQRARLGGISLDGSADALSVGQKQRLALIRLLLLDPDVLLLDEPTASLDGDSAAIIHAWLQDLHHDEGKTIIHVTHAPDPPRLSAAKSWLMSAGTIIEEDR